MTTDHEKEVTIGFNGATISGNIKCYGVQTFTEADGDLIFSSASIYVFGSLTINNTAANTTTGTPTIYLMSRTANFRPIGSVTANVVPYRFATAHRQRSIS